MSSLSLRTDNEQDPNTLVDSDDSDADNADDHTNHTNHEDHEGHDGNAMYGENTVSSGGGAADDDGEGNTTKYDLQWDDDSSPDQSDVMTLADELHRHHTESDNGLLPSAVVETVLSSAMEERKLLISEVQRLQRALADHEHELEAARAQRPISTEVVVSEESGVESGDVCLQFGAPSLADELSAALGFAPPARNHFEVEATPAETAVVNTNSSVEDDVDEFHDCVQGDDQGPAQPRVFVSEEGCIAQLRGGPRSKQQLEAALVDALDLGVADRKTALKQLRSALYALESADRILMDIRDTTLLFILR